MPVLCGLRKEHGSLVLCESRRPAAVAVPQIMQVVNLLFGTVSGQLFVTVLDRSNVMLCFEDAVACKKRQQANA